MRVPTTILQFAGGQDKIGPYVMFKDYYNQYRTQMEKATGLEFSVVDDKGQPISFEEKDKLMNAAFKREIMRIANVTNFEAFPLEAWVTNPMVSWATFAVVSAMVDMILPETIIDTIGAYTEIRNIGYGDSAKFDITPRDIFVVSKAGHAQRSTEIHKQYKGTVTITTEFRELTVAVSLYRVLSGHESLAEFVSKVVRSMETQVTLDAYNQFAATMAALSSTATTGLQVAGYTQASLVRLAQQVEAWNNGAKPVVMGTQLALVNVLPDDVNYRYTFDSEYVKVGYLRTAFGYDIMPLAQVADQTTPWGTVIANDRLWIVSPSSQKLVKLVLEGNTMSNTDTVFQNANLLQKSTLFKAWGVGVATNAVAAVLTI
jgi:hypothetical protein